MNAHQRRISMTRRHTQWPLGARVLVIGTKAGTLEGKIGKHWRGNDYACSIHFDAPVMGMTSHRVPFKKLVLVDAHLRGQRPWYKQRRAEVKA